MTPRSRMNPETKEPDMRDEDRHIEGPKLRCEA